MDENIVNIVNDLKNNGCRKDIIDVFYLLFVKNNKTEIIHVIRKYRQELQKTIDDEGKLIDCIDYLIYELEK